MLSYSSKESEQDLDSYFDSLPGQSSHAVLGHHHQSRKAAKSHHKRTGKTAQTEVSSDGLPVLPSRKKADKSKDRYEQEHKMNKEELQAYKFENPAFKKKLDDVHKQWLEKHDNIPASKSEKKEYNKLVLKVFGKSLGQVVKDGVEVGSPQGPPPDVKKQIMEAQNRFAKTHKNVHVS